MQIENWKTCPLCSNSLAFYPEPDTRVICTSCDFIQYKNPIPTAIVLPVNEHGQVLLVKRNAQPRLGYWSVIGGFLNIRETAENGARRECKEEIGVNISNIPLIYVGNYPSLYGNSGRQTLSITYYCHLTVDTEISLSEENSEWGWFDLDNLPTELAFTDCELALRDLPHTLQTPKYV